MSIIVEDGNGLANAESLISVSYFLSYHLARGNTNVNLLSTAESEEALRRASDYFMQNYNGRWKGYLLKQTQALSWPRQDVILSDGYQEYTIDAGVIPLAVQQAFADIAFKAASGELISDLAAEVLRKKVEGIEVEYSPYARQTKRYLAIDLALAPYLNNYGATRLIRS